MRTFADSYLGQLRSLVGDRLLIVVGTRVIVENSKGELLLQLRRDFNKWAFLGGNVEPGERPEECVAREVREETGLQLKELLPFGVACDPALETVTFPNGHMCQFFVFIYWTKSYTGEAVVDDDESLALEWFARSEMPEMLSTSMSQSLVALDKFRETGTFQFI